MDFLLSFLCPLLTSGVLFQISLAGTLDDVAPDYPSEGAKTKYNVSNTLESKMQEEQEYDDYEFTEYYLPHPDQLEEEKEAISEKLEPVDDTDVYSSSNKKSLLPITEVPTTGTLDDRDQLNYKNSQFPSERANTKYNESNRHENNRNKERDPEDNFKKETGYNLQDDDDELEKEEEEIYKDPEPAEDTDKNRSLNQEPSRATKVSSAGTLDERDNFNRENSQFPSERANTKYNESNRDENNRNEERKSGANFKKYKGSNLRDDDKLEKEKEEMYKDPESSEDTGKHRSLNQEPSRATKISRAGTTDDRDHLAPEKNVSNHGNTQFPSDRATTNYKECNRCKCNRLKEKEPENGFCKNPGYDLPEDAQLEKEKKAIRQKPEAAKDTGHCSLNQEPTTKKGNKINNPDLNCCQCRCLGTCCRGCWGSGPWVCLCPHTCCAFLVEGVCG